MASLALTGFTLTKHLGHCCKHKALRLRGSGIVDSWEGEMSLKSNCAKLALECCMDFGRVLIMANPTWRLVILGEQ